MAGNVEMVFWDVQHGHSTYIKSPNGKHIIVDLGIGSSRSNNEKFSPLMHLKTKYKVQQLDMAVITHPHKDHIDDIMNFDALSPKVLSRPNHLKREEIITDKTRNSDLPLYEKYIAINEYYNGKYEENDPRDPSNPENFGGLKIETFTPTGCPTSNLNNHSVVTVFEYATIKAVIPGDNEELSFKELMERPSFKEAVKNADILLASHHAREAGFYKEFVELVNPRFTVISDSSYKDTSKREWYTAKSRGWKVHYKDGTSEEGKKTLSTYYNGVIVVSFGWNEPNKPFLHIKTS